MIMELGQKFIFESISGNIREQTGQLSSFSFVDSSLEPTQWQLVARKKLAELVGYQAKRPLVETILTKNFVQFDSSFSRSKSYLRVNSCSDVPVTIVKLRAQNQDVNRAHISCWIDIRCPRRLG